MRAKVTTILSSLYICIYRDVFKVLDVNSREAVKTDPNRRDVKGAFLSLGTIRQPASLASWGRTRQHAQGDQAEVRQRTETVLQEGWEFWKIKNRSRRKPVVGTGPWGTGPWLSTVQNWMSPWALQVQPRLCQCLESSISAWMNLGFSGWFILNSRQTVEDWGGEQIFGPPYLPPKLQLAFFHPAPSNKGRAILASFWERKEPGLLGFGSCLLVRH